MSAASKPIVRVLKKSQDFLKLQKQGRKLRPVGWLILNFLENELGELRCGWTISGKVGSAVLRNRLKRWSRTYFRGFVKSAAAERLSVDVNLVFLKREDGFYRNMKYRDFDFILTNAMKQIAKQTVSQK